MKTITCPKCGKVYNLVGDEPFAVIPSEDTGDVLSTYLSNSYADWENGPDKGEDEIVDQEARFWICGAVVEDGVYLKCTEKTHCLQTLCILANDQLYIPNAE